jgi:two-component sensor histidine kinase
LIINEIATNSIKHGFSPDGDALFFIFMKWVYKDNQFSFVLGNNGLPFPEEVDLNNPRTLGLRLVSILVDQLGGTIEVKRKPHPEFKINFPVPRDQGIPLEEADAQS